MQLVDICWTVDQPAQVDPTTAVEDAANDGLRGAHTRVRGRSRSCLIACTYRNVCTDETILPSGVDSAAFGMAWSVSSGVNGSGSDRDDASGGMSEMWPRLTLSPVPEGDPILGGAVSPRPSPCGQTAKTSPNGRRHPKERTTRSRTIRWRTQSRTNLRCRSIEPTRLTRSTGPSRAIRCTALSPPT
jgi:hypothetical protein